MKIRGGIHFLLLSAAAALAACSHSAEHSKAAAPEPQVVAVAVVGRGSLAGTSVMTAEFQPFQEVDVMAKVAGYVRSIKVDLGDHVREGQVLAELEVPEMVDEVTRASAVVEQGGAEAAAARDELQRARAAHEIAHLSLTRLEEVSKKEAGLIPRQELDEARARDQVAEAQIAAAGSKVKVEEQRTRVARADETRLKTMRGYVTITAPFTFDGAGTFCWQSSSLGSFINSWNAASVTINGVNVSNQYLASGSYPAKINGYWYISYTSTVSFGHFEAK